MLVLAATEFIFFRVGSVGPCFVFGLETVLTIHGYFVTADVRVSASHTSKEAGGAKGVVRGHNWDGCLPLTQGIFHISWYHAPLYSTL